MKTLVPILLLAFAGPFVACGERSASVEQASHAGVTLARAELSPTEGHDVSGVVTFRRDGDAVTIEVDIEGLAPGKHGFHIHEKGDCSAPDASSAGGHFNPTGKPHGGPDDAARHVGDLGNVTASADGTVDVVLQDDVIALEGPNGILGKAVVVHAGEDDLVSQPSGAAGARVACGVVEPVAAVN